MGIGLQYTLSQVPNLTESNIYLNREFLLFWRLTHGCKSKRYKSSKKVNLSKPPQNGKDLHTHETTKISLNVIEWNVQGISEFHKTKLMISRRGSSFD